MTVLRKSAVSAVAAVFAATAPVPDFFPFQGGLDLLSSPLRIAPGRVVESQNFEAVNSENGGYRRISGYERIDGRPAPSDAQYAVLNVTLTGSVAVGDLVTGVTSAATAVVLAVVSGTPNYLVLTKIVGTFVSGETLNVSGLPQATTSSEAVVDGAASTLLHAQYRNLAADEYRADIAAVPGSGPVRGVVQHNDVKYAFRDNVGGTALNIYKTTSGGWTQVPVGEEISFTAGSGDIDEGDTLTRGGVTATIKRVLILSGTLSGGTAAGRLLVYGRLGGNYSAGAATTTGAGALTLSGAQSAITILPAGAYEFIKENFGGSPNTKRIYGADGENRGFEFDGSDYSYVPISTGMASDMPEHVWAHKKQLFFSFIGSVQHCAPGQPYVWSAILGAAELAMGDQVTGFASQPGSEAGGALAIYTRNRTSILYGSGVSDWNLVPYRDELGAYAFTIQDVGYTMFLDDRGITTLVTAQSFGNFAHATITSQIQALINEKRLLVSASCISRDRSQYRIFFTDKSALYVTVIGRKVLGIMPIAFQHTVRCAHSSEMLDGSEVMLFGSDDGYVFEMDKGTSFDGEAVEYYLGMPFHFSRTPRTRKHYNSGMFEMTGAGYADFSFTFDLSYGSGDSDMAPSQALASSFSAGRWDVGTWDAGVWDGRTLIPTEFDLTGSAENIALRIAGSSDYQDPFTFNGVFLHQKARRNVRKGK